MERRNQLPNRLSTGVIQPSTVSVGLVDAHIEIPVALLTVQTDSDGVVQANYHAGYLPRRQSLELPYTVGRSLCVRVRILDGRP